MAAFGPCLKVVEFWRSAAALPDCSYVRCIAPHLATTLAPGSFRENNEQWSRKIAATPTSEREPWTSDCKVSMRS
jgi:hypothetical protein